MKTGYEISYDDFIRLCSDHRDDVAPLLQKWFGYEVMPVSGGFALRDSRGIAFAPEFVHASIQKDFERQGSIYRLAMTLWR